MAPKKAVKKVYDYSRLEKGQTVQAESDGVYYAASVVQVSESKSRARAPVKINFKGYDASWDEWLGGDRLRSKSLQVAELEKREERKPLEINFGYWKIRGLGAVFRMIFEYKGVKYTDNAYGDFKKWFEEDKPRILEKNPLANLPYLECGNDCVCQTNACLNYLGRKLRMGGGGYAAQLLNEQLLNEIYDTRNNMIDLAYPFKAVCRDAAEHKEKAVKGLAGNPFKKFEDSLARSGTEYFCGKLPCTSDFHIWEMLDQWRLLAEKHSQPDIFETIPKCKAFYDRFRALPSLQKYFESEAYKYPVNNPLADAYFQ